ncbi:MAG TPA: ATP-binding protein [Patescibacteria group bacterium]|nr:ATP-binding protein [Patescibacteria group bacterium]
MKTITILSGKGGVGKSSISASLAFSLAQESKIVAADCDVDAANLALLFGLKKLRKNERISTNSKAFVNKNAKECKNIVKNCAFSAISWNKKKQLPEINEFLCEGCGVCKILCPKGIEIRKVENAIIGEGQTKYGFPIISGQLEMGESGSGKVVTVVKERARQKAERQKAEYLIIDSAPGIGCPVIASVRGSDYILAVTEPTPTAFRALQRVLEVVEHFNISYGIIINKSDLNRSFVKKIEEFAKNKNISIIAKIPFSKSFVEAMIKMKPIAEINPNYQKMFKSIISQIKLEIKNKKTIY